MWTSTILPDGTDTHYGFGWVIRSYRERRAVSHTGQVAGFVSTFTRLPDDELAIIVFRTGIV